MIAENLVMAADVPHNVTFEVMTDNTPRKTEPTSSKLAALQRDDLDTIILVDHLKGRTAFRNRVITKALAITGVILSGLAYYMQSI